MSLRINHHPSGNLLSSYLKNGCTPLERQRIDVHLACCAACSEKLETERKLFALLGDLPLLHTADDYTDRIMHAISAPGKETNPKRQSKRYSRKKVELMHAMVALAVTCMLVSSGALNLMTNQWTGKFGYGMQEAVNRSVIFGQNMVIDVSSSLSRFF